MAVRPDKEVKKEFKLRASAEPDKYYATNVLRTEGFVRNQCAHCGTWFWNVDPQRTTCDDAACSGGFRFFENNPAKKALDFVEVWRRFSKLFTELGYTAINRYPTIARWRDDTDFVQASIYNFQPYVVSGEIDPPANPLVVPQFSLRFNDIDNVGMTMSHMTGFVMIGQHAFVKKDDWDQDKVFKDIYTWLVKGIGLPKEEITFHEDAWAGGGNFGPCMEFFSRGCELGNQVYMLFEQTEDGDRDLPLKVLDMGMGHERVAWFTQGKGTIYDAAYPTVMEKLYKITGVEYDEQIIQKYLPHAPYLNVDEIDDVEEAWKRVAQEVGVDTQRLKSIIKPLAALYSVAEHARSLLVALSDGGLPSNVGGGYNLRVILRRALGFLQEYQWKVSLQEIIAWHADYLSKLYPEISDNLDDVYEIISHEKEKYEESQKRNKQLLKRLLEQGNLVLEKMLELYDSHGISPEDLLRAAKEMGKELDIPDNFYSLIAERHAQTQSKTATKKEIHYPVEDLPATKALYFDHYDLVSFEARVLKIQDDWVVLDETAFYPTSGGQIHDLGTLGGVKVVDVIKQATPQGTIIIHKVSDISSFQKGDTIAGKIDFDRRLQLAQHHTATHILTGSARQVLGNHVWQAGAAKTVEKSRLDITHYKQITEQELAKIEDLANQMVIENKPVIKQFMARDLAEKRYGFRLYQGGAVPGKQLRIVEIPDFDAEACGGTHLNTTGEIRQISIVKTSKIQDGVVRIEFVAGGAAADKADEQEVIIDDICSLLGGKPEHIPGRVQELFVAWKKAKKKKLESFELSSTTSFEGDVIIEASKILRTQPEHLIKTIKRFISDIERYTHKEKKL